MDSSERIDALEEQLTRMQDDLDQLDAAVQSLAAADAERARRLQQIETRLARLEAKQSADGEDATHGEATDEPTSSVAE